MIRSFKQRLASFPRPPRGVLYGLWLILLAQSAASAQTGDELFRGTWQVTTPDQGVLIILLQNNGRAAYFWGETADTTVYQGTWSSTPEAATATWADGAQHRIEPDRIGFGTTFFEPSGREAYIAPAQQVPSEVLGQWAKPPTRDQELRSDRDQAEGFFGIWRINEPNSGESHFVFVENDRSVASTLGEGGGLRGAWARQGSELHIAWDTGHYSILRETRRNFTYKRIAPGQIIEEDRTEPAVAIRTTRDNVPSDWLTAYEREQKIHTGGIAFATRREARSFYRGSWLIQLGEERFERIELTRFGALNTSLDRSLSGEWRMQGQDIFLRWDDGMRKILSPIGRGFVLYEYRPGRPLDGVPTRIRAAAPADSSKLEQYTKGREDIAQKMRSLADAAGIEQAQQNEAGWGRTFTRWVWPFGEDASGASSDAILRDEFEESTSSDPWWWPVWSENTEQPVQADADQKIEPAAELLAKVPNNSTSEIAPPAAKSDGAEAAVTPADEGNPEKKRRSARDWVWPF